ncbi:unnamed protein product, partial [Sphacelaria rigidula]
NGKSAREGLVAKYQNPSKQRRRLLMRQLDTMTMSPGQDPDVFLAQVFQLRDELVHIGEPISDERLTNIIVKDLTSEYGQIKYNAERDPDFGIGEIESTLRNMYAKRLARKNNCEQIAWSRFVNAGSSNISNQPAKFRGKCYCCGNVGHRMRDSCSRRQSNNGNMPVQWCALHRTDQRDDSEC